MELNPNPEPPEIMHIDLNSAFATTEQQANPLLRGRPVGITNRLNDYAICITASYEAKQLGIGIGTRAREARALAPGFVMLESDPAKYRYVHNQLKAIFRSYSDVAYMKSIDEGIIDFRSMRALLKGRSMEDIAAEIKQRIREEVGDYMTVNIGIGQNRWLAKVAAGLNKPDGLVTINNANRELIFATMELVDLPYIKHRMRVRLNAAGIYTSLDFLRASEPTLAKQVFRSINGHHWYLKLRGYETEVEYGIRTIGRSYVLEHRTSDPEEIDTLLYKFSVKVARRMAGYDLAARGLMLSLGYAVPKKGAPGYYPGLRYGWFQRQMFKTPAFRGDQLFHRAQELYRRSPGDQLVASMHLTAYGLEPVATNQPYLWDNIDAKRDRAESVINAINDKYGELVVAPATVVKSKNPMKDKVPFGSIRYF